MNFHDHDNDNDKGIIVAKENDKWRIDPKGCFRIGICEIESNKKIYAEHSPIGKRIVGETAKEVMDTILRLDMVSLLEHASYLSKELTKAELAMRLNRSYEQDEELFHNLSEDYY